MFGKCIRSVVLRAAVHTGMQHLLLNAIPISNGFIQLVQERHDFEDQSGMLRTMVGQDSNTQTY